MSGSTHAGAPEVKVDVAERGANGQSSHRRLFMQLQAFGGCPEPKLLAGALERSQIDAVLYADLQNPRGVGVLSFSEDPAFFVTRLREVLGAEPFASLAHKPALAMIGRSYASGYEQDLEDWLLRRPRRTVLDSHDNDFLIGLVGKDLQPLSHLVQAMRKTAQTSEYMASLGPFFVGHVLWQSPSR